MIRAAIGSAAALGTWWLLGRVLLEGWRAEQRGDPLPAPDPRPPAWRIVPRPPFDWQADPGL